MKSLRIRSASEQLADFLRDEIRHRTWTGVMPGESWLVTNLQVGRDTVRAAMAQLEEEGILRPHGQGQRRQIVMSEDLFATRKLRVRILTYDKQDMSNVECANLVVQLEKAGFDAEYAAKSLQDLGMRVERVARFVTQNPADAWVVCAGSREIIEWFSVQPIPAIAMFGRVGELPIAAATSIMIPGQTAAVKRLIELGHRRIVMLTREERRKPELSRPERFFIDQLQAAGITTGDYNLPDWEETREGLKKRLDEHFRFSPPTAIIFQEAELYIAARLHLADRGIVAPRDVSLIVADNDRSFDWFDTVVSQIHLDYRPVVRRVVLWAKNVARAKDDRKHVGTEAEFIEGGTIGPAPR